VTADAVALAALRRSPLAHLADAMAAGSGPAVALAEEPFLTMVAVRRAATSSTTVALPERVGETATTGEHTALWLGPNEWLVVSTAEPDELTALLEADLGEGSGQVVDVSANRTTLALSGPRARGVLEKGCGVDLHPRAFGPGNAVLTTVARVPVLLWQTGPEAYRILPRSSFADYLARWLLDAMVEYVS